MSHGQPSSGTFSQRTADKRDVPPSLFTFADPPNSQAVAGQFLVVTGATFALVVLGLLAVVLGYRYKILLSRRCALVPARVVQRVRMGAILEWKFRGETYVGSPRRVYALRKGESTRVYLHRDTGMLKCIDTWSQNGTVAYVIGALAWVASGILFLVGAFIP